MPVYGQGFQEAPFKQFTTITPSDSQTLAAQGVTGLRGLYVLTAGNLVLRLQRDKTSFTIPVTAGQVLHLFPTQIYATNSTATVVGIS